MKGTLLIQERERAAEEAQRRAVQAALIYKVGRRVSSELELDELLSTIVTTVCDAFDYYGVMLLLLDEEAKCLTMRSIAGGYADVYPEDFRLAIGEGMIGHAAATGEPQFSGDVSKNPHYVHRGKEETKSELAIPIKSGQKVIGVLDLQSDEFDVFDEIDVAAMEALNAPIATAIENARLFEEARSRAEELAVLNELGQALTARLDVEQVLEEAHRQAARLLDTTNFFIALYDPEKHELTFAFQVTESEIDRETLTVMSADQGVSGYIVRNRTSVLTQEDVVEQLEKIGVEMVGELALSWLGVPLMIGDQVLGVMAVQSYTIPSLYDEHDHDLLTAIASQAAIALQNAYLFEEARSRAEELAVLNELGQALTARLNVDRVLEEAYRQAARLVDTTNFTIGLYDPEKDEITFPFFTTESEIDRQITVMPASQGMNGYIIRNHKSLFIRENLLEWHEERGMEMVGEPSLCWLGVPLMIGDQVLGVMSIQSFTTPHFYDEHDRDLLTAIANQTAIAIQNARLFEEARTRADELAVLNELGQALTAQLNVEQVLEEAYRQASRLLDTTNFYIAFYDPEKDEITFPFTVDSENDDWRPIKKGEGLTGRIIEVERPLLLPTGAAGLWKTGGEVQCNEIGPPALSWMGAPLMIGDQVLGVMAVQSYTTPDLYDEHDRDLLTAIASQAAIALQNAYLFEETRSRAERLAVVNRIAKAAGATLRLDDLMETVYRESTPVFQADAFFIALYDEETDELDFPFLVDGGVREPPERHPLGIGLSSIVVTEKKPLVIRDEQERERLLSSGRLFGTMKHATSWLGAPLMIGERVIGVISAQAYRPHAWDEEDEQLLFTIADQVAVAIENARLYEAIERELIERKRMDKALRESERRFRSIAETAGDAIVIFDSQENIFYWNRAAQAIFGYQNGETRGSLLAAIIPEQFHKVFRQEMKRGVSAGTSDSIGKAIEMMGIRKDGSEFPLELSLAAWSIGENTYFTAIARDITERKQAEERIRESEERYRASFDNSSDAINVFSKDRKIVDVNKKLVQLSGYSKEEILSMGLKALYPEAATPSTGERLKILLQGKEAPVFETDLLTKDGTRIPVEIGVTLLRNCYGQEFVFQGNIRDITERKQAEEALERRAVQLALLNDIGKKIAAVLDLDSVLDRAARLVQESFDHHHVALFTTDREQDTLVMRAKAGDFAHLFSPDHRLKMGKGIVGWVGRHGETLLVNDVDAEPRYVNLYPDVLPTRSELSVPIRAGEEIVGVLDVQSPQSDAFNENDVTVMETLAGQIAVAIDNARLFEEIQRRVRELQLLHDVGLAITSVLDLDTVLQQIVDITKAHFGYYYIGIGLVYGDTMIIWGGSTIGDSGARPEFSREGMPLTHRPSLMIEAARTEQPVLADDVLSDPRYLIAPELPDTRSELCLPIKIKGRVIGVLDLESDRPNAFNQADVALFQLLASQAGVAIDNARLYEETQRRMGELRLLYDVGLAAASRVGLEETLQAAAEALAAQFGDPHVGIALLDQESSRLHHEAGAGYLADAVKNLSLPLGKGIIGWVAQHGEPVLVPDVRLDSRYVEGIFDTRSELCVPLIAVQRVIGVINIESPRLDHFTEDDLRLLSTLANNLAMLIERARLFEEVKAARFALQQHTEALARSNAELEQFAYVASHDLQEPLRMVTSYLQLLERRYKDKLDEDADEFIAFAVDGATRMQALINSLLKYSRVSTRAEPFEPVDCSDILNRALFSLQVTIEENSAVVTHDTLPTVNADGTQLAQVFQNLISNGIKFHGDRPPEIHVGAERLPPPPAEEGRGGSGEWLFSVRDNGIGIDPQHFERIFRIFQRLHSRSEYPGTGIGLTICTKVVERHGGRLWVESELGQGSTFYFTIPDKGGELP